MLRQYDAQRCRGGDNPLRVGVIAVGSIYYLQDRDVLHGRFGGRDICRAPWIVEAFLNGTMGAARRNRDTGRWEDAVRSGRSDIAVVRSLRDRRRTLQVRVSILIDHDDAGFGVDTRYPGLPDLRFYRTARRLSPSRAEGRRRIPDCLPLAS